jgi:hypothetical protein
VSLASELRPSAPARRPAPGAHRTDALTDIALTTPLFLAYHVGVAFLPVRNAADVVTSQLAEFSANSRLAYVGLTLALGVVVALGLLAFGHRDKFRCESFALVAVEGVVYAMAMRLVAGYVVGRLALAAPMAPAAVAAASSAAHDALTTNTFTSFVMACGAGVYEEITFRLFAFGIGARLLIAMDDWTPWVVSLLWALVTSIAFSAWHHMGALGEPFALEPFVFRTVCGLAFTAIFAFRGLAPAVWTHALYDMWVLIF